MAGNSLDLIPAVPVEGRILVVRGRRVILDADLAVLYGVTTVRAFVRLRERLALDREVAEKVAELERRALAHDETLRGLVETLRELLEPTEGEEENRPRIGFGAEDEGVAGE